MRNDLSRAIRILAAERSLPEDVIMDALEAAMVAAYRKTPDAWAQNVRIGVDPETGERRVFAQLAVVEDVQDERTQISPEDAHAIDPDAELGDVVETDVTPEDFGRIAAQTAKQVILQRIREAEREATYHTYADREGEVVHGIIQNAGPEGITIGLDKAEALLPRANQMPSEQYPRNQRIRVYVQEVRRTSKGPEIIVSRTHKYMLRRLMEVEVPEIFNGAVEIKAIAREAGSRSKVAVAARQEGVDPVGACVGIRGVRIQALVNELNGEKIDVVAWDPDPSVFIANALSPAQVTKVRLLDAPEGRTAEVVVPDRQLSLAIGKEGQNARLAAKLTGWRIDIKSESEATEEAFRRIQAEARRAEEKRKLDEARRLLAEAEAKEAEEAAAAAAQPEEEAEPAIAAEAEPEIAAETEPEEAVEVAAEVTEPEESVEEVITAEVAEPETEVAAEAEPEVAQADVAPETDVAEADIAAEAEEAEEPAWDDLIKEELTFAEDEEEPDWEESADKQKKKRKQRRLVYDENLGEVVARKRRKPGRRADRWEREANRWRNWDADDMDLDEESDDAYTEDWEEDYKAYLQQQEQEAQEEDEG
jgi:N utilization substance protein A